MSLFCGNPCTFKTQKFWLRNKRYDTANVFFDIVLAKLAKCFLDFRGFHGDVVESFLVPSGIFFEKISSSSLTRIKKL